ncbi:aspartyl-phosphate phosphatase Spo0E family protein [Sporolactobacillus sp. CPB3-1]|uniref:Aspartyl-phosphate phosphatase Spo0E family protein n=1 Tax=Sporolactobacillus mangiferae TaxID=2940498 RepID=A0ABT0MB90_9BACL|nr:aspartyl-phosphate phosphatase Spo0E family protein [Sporolactobacillus mangiferae]MCL1632133.1 aspartyl-phosphate phosphatase Spo0E family protein [Sporolactobacillus mangiferae]
MEKQQLIEKIEALRSIMIRTAAHQSLSSAEIQHLSSHLDQLLNQYERLVRSHA